MYYFRVLMVVAIVTVVDGFTKSILIIASYHKENIWTTNCIEGVKNVIGDTHDVTILYMDTKRKAPSEHRAIADKTWKHFLEIKPDLVVTADDNALKYLGRRFAKQTTPVVFMGVNGNPREYFDNGKLPQNVVGVLERHLLIPIVRLFKDLIPMNKNKVLILFDDSQSTKATVKVALHGKKSIMISEVNVEWQSFSYMDDWKNAVTHSSENYDFIIMENWFTVKKRKSGEVVNPNYILEWTGQNSTIPAVSINEYAVGSKMLMGALVLTGEDHGADAGELILNIFNNTIRNPIRTTRTGTYYFNREGLKKYNITLPIEIEKKAQFK